MDCESCSSPPPSKEAGPWPGPSFADPTIDRTGFYRSRMAERLGARPAQLRICCAAALGGVEKERQTICFVLRGQSLGDLDLGDSPNQTPCPFRQRQFVGQACL